MSSSSQAAKRHSMNTIESSVTKLLVATKHLLESLTKWASLAATETDISDAYVQLGNEFKVACRAFINAGVDVSDLGDVPHSLRVVLEQALCEQPSQESLDRFLPNIREIIVTLLQNLKTKQALVRNIRGSKSKDQLKLEGSPVRRSSSSASPIKGRNNNENSDSVIKQRGSSRLDPPNFESQQQQKLTANNQSRLTPPPPQIKVDTPNDNHSPQQDKKRSELSNNALAQLQKGDSLQRRASRRFSAYQYAKLTNAAPSELPDQSINLAAAAAAAVSASNAKRSSLRNTETASESNDSSVSKNVFLRIGNKVKKAAIPPHPTLTSLRLLFVEKFAYSPGSGQFPDIYIKDPTTNVSYELEEHLFSDITESSVLSLNINENNQIVETLKGVIEELKLQLSKKQHEFLQLTKDYITESNINIMKKLEDATTATTSLISTPLPTLVAQDEKPTDDEVESKKETSVKIESSLSAADIADIRFELSVIKQINSTNKSTFQKSIESVLGKINDFKALSVSNAKTDNRQYMEDSHSKLSLRSDNLLTRFDDLQDLIEALRKDVATRGAKPTKKQLDYVAKELEGSQKDFEKLISFIALEKPNWKKIWENELDIVCNEQQFLTLQEDLIHDLREDFERAYETYKLVEQCCEEQTKNPKIRTANLPLAEPVDLPNLRDTLLSEVQSLRPDHDSRVAAIERAEKLREKERQLTMINGFEEELGGFVEENKLKKSGGIEEVERMRRQKDEENLKSNFPPLY